MYAGISAETLYSSTKSNLAFGLEVNHVKARDFKQLLGMRSLDGLSKTNGHLSAYWNTNYVFPYR